jgi:hypothetical protein
MNHQAYKMARFSPALALVAGAMGLGSASCMGDDSANHNITQLPIPPTVVLVDGFETASAPGAAPSLSTMNVTEAGTIMFAGGWYVFDDGSLPTPEGGTAPEGKQVVSTDTLSADDTHVTLDGKESKGALRIRGGPYPGPWGAGVTGQLNNGAPFDASAYSGIMFWAKKVELGVESSVTVSIPTIQDTYQDGGTTCKNPPTPGKSDGCSDGFHRDISLRSTWTLNIVYFSDLTQQGYGYKPPGGFDKKNTLAINFGNKQAAPFDEYIDDLAFFKDNSGN